jgi:hypothetical protein
MSLRLDLVTSRLGLPATIALDRLPRVIGRDPPGGGDSRLLPAGAPKSVSRRHARAVALGGGMVRVVSGDGWLAACLRSCLDDDDDDDCDVVK